MSDQSEQLHVSLASHFYSRHFIDLVYLLKYLCYCLSAWNGHHGEMENSLTLTLPHTEKHILNRCPDHTKQRTHANETKKKKISINFGRNNHFLIMHI